MFIEAVVLGIIIGIIRRGKISRIAYVDFNMLPVVYISAVLYVSIIIMNLGLFDYNSILYTVFLILLYILAGIFLIANLNKKFMIVPLLGFCINFLTFVANKFRFPISSEALVEIYGADMNRLLFEGKMKFFIPEQDAALSFLGNVIPIGNLFIVSIGDIIIAIGIILVIQSIISDKYIKNRNRITFSKNIFK